MTEFAAALPEPAQPSPDTATPPWVERNDLRLAAVTVGALVVVGALAGLVWAAWSRPATSGLVYTKTAIIPDQTEGYISTDGRFAVVSLVIGLIAGLLVWRRRGDRGPAALVGLGVGAVLGALIADVVGRAVHGGTTHGAVGNVIGRLPLQVHATGLLFLEAAVAVATYVLCAAFVNPDDLGRGSGSGSAAEHPGPASVGAGLDAQQAGRDRDAAGSAQQHDLSP